jgi:hypothetical protein
MSSNLDFDYLTKLYQTDPEKFEEIRQQEIEKLISKTSERQQKRLRGVQFQIDAKREIHKHSPVGSCIAISKMMHESFEELRFHLNQVANIRDPLGYQDLQNEVSSFSEEGFGKVIEFRR